MKLYINTSTDPYFNLAAEEYLLTHAKDDIIMLWRNEPSVIIGKNQNAFAEINFDFVHEHGIKVVRRLTGGGAVFHDLGNLNYTFISPVNGQLAGGIRAGGLDFAYFTKPVIAALRELSLDASLSGRNDIVVRTCEGEKKISGNAQCVVDGTTLHHGTLLFSAELSRLSGALNADPAKLKSKGIASVRSRVANICELLGGDVRKRVADVRAFTDYLARRLCEEFGTEPETIPEAALEKIGALAESKYSLDEWNYRRFGDFSTKVTKRLACGSVEACFTVSGGRITELVFSGDFFGEEDVSMLSKRLTGVDYSRKSVEQTLRECSVERYFFGSNADEITNLLLSATSVL